MPKIPTVVSKQVNQSLFSSSRVVDYHLPYYAVSLEKPHWWTERSSSYLDFRIARYPSRSSTLAFTHGDEILHFIYGAGNVSESTDSLTLYHNSEQDVIEIFKDPRWVSSFPLLRICAVQDNLQYSIDALDLKSAYNVCIPDGHLLVNPTSSVSHFLAESFPRLIIGSQSKFCSNFFSVGLKPWQRMLVDQLANFTLGSHTASDSIDVFTSREPLYRLSSSHGSFVEAPPFYDGLALTTDYLNNLYRYSQVRKLDLDSLSRAYERGRGSISRSTSKKKIYISRLYHESLSLTSRPPRCSNYNELALAAHANGWFVMCPERYTFWSIYRTISECDEIIVDNGTSQIFALINSPFIRRLHEGNAKLTILAAPDYVKDCDADEAWLWHINCLSSPNFKVECGVVDPCTSSWPPYMQSCEFDPNIFKM